MTIRTALRAAALAIGLVAIDAPTHALHAQLRVRADGDAGAWREWWNPRSPVHRWRMPSRTLSDAARWTAASPGVELATLALSGAGEAWRLSVVLVRLDPAQVTPTLDADVDATGTLRPWTIDGTTTARGAHVALNAGQFTDAGPWGWLVHEGRELQAPGRGALSGALVARDDGRVMLVDADSLVSLRRRSTGSRVIEALQSYPMLISTGGVVPPPLRADAARYNTIDLHHRDARLAIGELRDGRLVIALTRFTALGNLFGRIPLGLTVPEMAALMGGLGCHRALMLDGGISAQLALTTADGTRHQWPGLRRVPLGLTFSAR